MNFRIGRREDPDVSLTPLIDVVFLLLIFFMISTTFQREARINIELPEASAEQTEEPATRLEIVIDVDGRFYIDDQEVINTRPESLRRAVRLTIGQTRDMPVIIRADARTPHQAVVTAMDVVSRLGLVNISLATVRAP